MSATTVRELLVELGVDAKDSAEQLDKIDAGVDKVKDLFIVATAAAAAFAVGLYTLATGAAEAADAVATSATKTGVAVEQYQELAYAASQSNVETQTLDSALVKQTNSLAELADGTEAQVEAYTALGLSQEELAGLSPDEAFLAIADAASTMSDEQERLQALTDIYGSELAAKLLPLIEQGGDGLSALADEAQALGLVMSEEDVEAAAEFNDQLDSMWAIVLSVRNEIGLKLIPFLTKLVTAVQDWVAANRELIDQKLEKWTGYVVDGLEMAWEALDALDDLVTRVFGGWEPILVAAAGTVATLGAAFVALQAASFWGTISTAVTALGAFFGLTFGQVILVVGAVVAAAVGLGLIMQDLWVYMNGGDSVIGRLLERFPALQSFVTSTGTAMSGVASVAVRLWDLLKTLGAIWYEVFSVTSLPVIMAVGAALLWLGETALAGVGWWLTNVVTPALNLVAAGLAWIEEKASGVLGALSAITGGSVSVSGGSSVAGASSFAPTAAEVVGSSTSTSSSKTVSLTQQVTNQISGLGLSQEEVEALMNDANATAANQAAAAIEGATV